MFMRLCTNCIPCIGCPGCLKRRDFWLNRPNRDFTLRLGDVQDTLCVDSQVQVVTTLDPAVKTLNEGYSTEIS